MASRASDALSKIPFVTTSLLVLNCGIHAVIFLFSLNINKYAISADQVLKGEYYRVFSATFVHGGIMHIAMNMSSLLQVGASLEAQFGSAQFAILTLWSTILIGAVYVLLSWIAAVAFHDANQLRSSGVGFSGVLFCYAIIEANHTVEVTRSFYGMFNVPAKLMPFLLLIVLQIVIPNVSWLGHLSGVIVGLFCISEAMNFFMPTEAFFEYVELTIVPFRNISRLSSYVRCTGNTCIISSSSSIFGTVGSGIRYVLTQAWNVIAVVLHIIGFPTDACCASLRRCFSPVTSAFESCCSSAPRPQLHTQTLLPMSVDMSGVRSSSAWGGGGPSEGRGHTLGGRGTTSTLTSLSNPAGGAKGGYAQLPSEV